MRTLPGLRSPWAGYSTSRPALPDGGRARTGTLPTALRASTTAGRTLGDTFTFPTASAVSGFGAAARSATGLAPGLGFQVNVGAADLTLEIVAAATAVPEPASAALLALGLGGLWARGRRGGRRSRRVPVPAPWALRRIAGPAVALLCLSLAATSASAYLVQAVGTSPSASRSSTSSRTF